MVQIIFLNPSSRWYPITKRSKKAGIEPLKLIPPLGLAYLVSIARKFYHDSEIRVIDANALNYSFDYVIELINSIRPKYLAVTSSIENRDTVVELSKRIHSSIIKLIGGADPSAIPNLYANHYDFVFVGEGEISFRKFLEKQNPNDIPGIFFKRNSEVINTGQPVFFRDLDNIPLPSWHLFPFEKYKLPSSFIKTRKNFIVVITSRGCPYNCKYCGTKNVFLTYRERSIPSIIEEIKTLYLSFGVRTIWFADDVFTLNLKRLKALCREIIKLNFTFNWVCLTRADSVDRHLLKLMKQAGCFLIFFGVESVSKKTLDYLGTRPSLSQIERAVRLAKKYRIMTKLNYIVGFPTDTREDIMNILSHAKHLKPDIIGLLPINLLPKTTLSEDFKKNKYSEKEIRKLINQICQQYYFRFGYIFPRIFRCLNPFYFIRYMFAIAEFLKKLTK